VDFENAKINGKPATDAIKDRAWLETTFLPQCQTRGAAVIKSRGMSSAMSAANGAIDQVKSWIKSTSASDWVSAGLVSKGEYGVPAGMVFSYPVRSDGQGNFSIVQGLSFDAFGQEKFKATLKELEEERDAVKEMLPG
jgi:malate dehydrogenase